MKEKVAIMFAKGYVFNFAFLISIDWNHGYNLWEVIVECIKIYNYLQQYKLYDQ